jgi:hypothetical protein
MRARMRFFSTLRGARIPSAARRNGPEVNLSLVRTHPNVTALGWDFLTPFLITSYKSADTHACMPFGFRLRGTPDGRADRRSLTDIHKRMAYPRSGSSGSCVLGCMTPYVCTARWVGSRGDHFVRAGSRAETVARTEPEGRVGIEKRVVKYKLW